jgi:hypothetical protein
MELITAAIKRVVELEAKNAELEEKLKTWKELYDDQLDYSTKLNYQN